MGPWGSRASASCWPRGAPGSELNSDPRRESPTPPPEPERIAAVRTPGDVDGYLRRREGRVWQPWKRWGERRALRRCLRPARDLAEVCDCPCGPGRLFAFWRRRGLRVIGVDRSAAAVAAARGALAGSGAQGEVLEGDVAQLSKLVAGRADLVACIRFLYYFDAAGRARLLRGLAEASRRYVLVEYRSGETQRARRNARRGRGPDKQRLTAVQMRRELRAAGLEPLRLVAIGGLSERAFALAERSGAP